MEKYQQTYSQESASGNEELTSRVNFLNRLRTRKFRNRLALFSWSLFTGAIILVMKIYLIDSGSDYFIPNGKFNDMIQGAIEVRIEQSNILFQFAVIFITAIWGLIIAKKGEAVLFLQDNPEITMLVLASTSLIGSFVSHLIYIATITELFVAAGRVQGTLDFGLPDMFAPEVNYLFTIQYLFLGVGSIITGIMFISAHKLK